MRALPALFVAALAASVARADVIVVQPGGSGAAALTAAIASAAAGDVLLLEAGDYSQVPYFDIPKGITLLPAPGAGRIALPRVRIIPPLGQSVVLRGFDIGAPGSLGTALYIDDCFSAWLEDCNIRGGDGLPTTSTFGSDGGSTAVIVDDSFAAFRNCTIVGGRGGDGSAPQSLFATSGGYGLIVSSFWSSVALHDCTVVGGDSGDGTTGGFFVVHGGHAVGVDSGDLTIAGCTVTGGAEGADNDAVPGTSGSGIVAFSASTDVRVLQSTVLAGGAQGAGTQSPAVWDLGGNKVVFLSEPARSLVLPDQVREGESGTLVLDGEPGDLAMVLLSAQAWFKPLKGQDGTLLTSLATLQGPLVIAVLAGPDGELQLPFTLPDLPVGLEAATVFVQGLFKDAGGTSLGGASALTWIDEAF